jgi:Mrp family chromosome partitioning ATPase
MSRMFRVVTGSPAETPSVPPDRPATVEVTPFVEVGGPEGVVTSAAKPVAPQPPAARPQPPVAERHSEPPLPEHTKYLSVTFHKLPKPGLRLMQTGIAPEVVVYHFPDHPVSGEYRQVRDEIVRQFDEPGPRVVLFTSASPSAGTSTVLLNHAVGMTQEYGSRVLVVDAHFDRPGVARRLGCAESPGLAEVMGQAIPLAWALQPTPVPNLHVLSTGIPTDATEEQMASDFPKLLHQLRQWFDWVVVDAGVWGDLPNGDAACESTDAVFLVTRSGDIELPGFGGLRGEVSNSGGQVRGFISTRV